jgi:hypothetical protein
MPHTDFRELARTALAARFTNPDTVADALNALEPVFASVDAEIAARPSIAETFADVRDTAVSEARGGLKTVQETLRPDGPVVTGIAGAVSRAAGFVGRKADEFRKADADQK